MRLGLRAVWRWAALEVVPSFAVIAVMATIFWLIGDHIGIRVWAELAFFLVIFTAGFSLVRHRWMRRSAMRGPGKG